MRRPGNFALERRVVVEQAVHDGGAARVGQQFALVADQAAGRRVEDQALAAAARGTHVPEIAAALGHLLHDDAGMPLVDVDDHFLDRLEPLAGDRIDLEHDARARHGELEAFAAHGLDQDAELQLAAARHLVGVLRFGLLADADGDVALGFLEQPVADDAALHLVAFLTGKRPVVDAKHHGERRRVDRLGEKRLVDGRIAQRVGDRRLRDAGDGDDVAGLGEIHGRPLQAAEGQHLGDARGLDQRAVAAHGLDGLVGLDAARADAAGQDASEIGIGFQRGGEQAEGAFFHDRRRHVLEDELEQRRQVGLRARGVDRHPAVAARAVEDGEVELLVAGVEVGEQIEDLVQHRVVALVGPVDLVDDDDGAQALLERLGDHELGLRQRSLARRPPARWRRRPC